MSPHLAASKFLILHTDIDQAFGFEKPILKIIKSYPENHPEKFIHLNAAKDVPDYHLMGSSQVLEGEKETPQKS